MPLINKNTSILSLSAGILQTILDALILTEEYRPHPMLNQLRNQRENVRFIPDLQSKTSDGVNDVKVVIIDDMHGCLRRGVHKLTNQKSVGIQNTPITHRGGKIGENTSCRIVVCPSGKDHFHPAHPKEIAAVMKELLHGRDTQVTVTLPTITREMQRKNLYGQQEGRGVFLFPQPNTLTEDCQYPSRDIMQETRMFGGEWKRIDRKGTWRLKWTLDAIRDFFLHNILPHEVGHIIDDDNVRHDAREEFANAFASENGKAIARKFGVLPQHDVYRRHNKKPR